MNYLLLFLSVCINAACSAVQNYMGKSKIKNPCDNYAINMLIYAFGAVILIVLAAATYKSFSLFAVLFGTLFGILLALQGVFQLKAFSRGPMSFTILIVSSSMILPAFSGALIWNEELSYLQVIGTLLMIAAAYFTAVKDGEAASLKWFCYTMLLFLIQGSLGIMQKIQQKSAFAEETTTFLATAFMTATVVCLLCQRFSARENTQTGDGTQKKGVPVLPLTCGAMLVFLNIVNLYLSGILPGVVFFPVQNGGTTLLSVLCAIAIFREKLNKRKCIGLMIGFVALVLLLI